MSAALPAPDRPLTREEYYRWCDAQPSGRFERIDGRIAAMAPERGAHLRVKGQVFLELRRAVAAAGWRSHTQRAKPESGARIGPKWVRAESQQKRGKSAGGIGI